MWIISFQLMEFTASYISSPSIHPIFLPLFHSIALYLPSLFLSNSVHLFLSVPVFLWLSLSPFIFPLSKNQRWWSLLLKSPLMVLVVEIYIYVWIHMCIFVRVCMCVGSILFLNCMLPALLQQLKLSEYNIKRLNTVSHIV